MLASTSVLAVLGAPPTVPAAFTAIVTLNTSGTIPGLTPSGVTVKYMMQYDLANRRLRKDTCQQHSCTSNILRFDENISPPPHPQPGEPTKPMPVGYQFRTETRDHCCWLWLFDPDTSTAEKMNAIQIPPTAADLGPDKGHGGAKHWQLALMFPFTSISDYWTDANGTLVQNDNFVGFGARGGVLSKSTYRNVVPGPIDVSNFAHPDLSECKQFGKDHECDASDAAELLAAHKSLYIPSPPPRRNLHQIS